MLNRQTFYNQKLAELHVHVGGAADPAVLWNLAHEQGIKLPTKDFWEFVRMFTIVSDKIDWEDFHKLFYWTELIQSSTQAIQECVHQIVGGAYRNCNITLLEISFNPMFRCRGGERDMDHIIMSAIHGMDKALLEYPQVKAGLIFLIDRRLSLEKNEIIIQKAIKYKNRGVVGIDLAGPDPEKGEFDLKSLQSVFTQARKAGLGTAVHCGEHKGGEEVAQAIKFLNPDRIIHGIQAYKNKAILQEIQRREITVCLCPTVNLKTGFIRDLNQLKEIVLAFKKSGVKFCINTDNPEFFQTNIIKEFKLLLENKILTQEELLQTNKIAFQSSFILKGGNNGF